MTAPADPVARRVARLLRSYPRSWRARYGEEFAELLLAELAEEPRNCRRTADVVVAGMLARCTSAGLTNHELPQQKQIQYGVATLCCALAVFLTFGVAMMAQLATGWQWVAPRSASAVGASVAMSVAAACLALIGLCAAVPVAWRAVVTAVGRRDGRLAGSAGLMARVAAGVLIVGTLHFQNSWPGTGGTGALHEPGPRRNSRVRLGIDAVGVVVLGASCAARLLPASELAWMVLSPVIGITLMIAAAAAVRRLALASSVIRYLDRLARGSVPGSGRVL